MVVVQIPMKSSLVLIPARDKLAFSNGLSLSVSCNWQVGHSAANLTRGDALNFTLPV